MSADMPEHSDAADDLTRAYAQANALAGDGRGPSASVRANVLAAARDVAAAEAAARVVGEAGAALPLTPVAPPVADVGRGRSKAINLSSWRVRSGAALAAMLVVGLAGWHFDAARRFNDGEQVAVAGSAQRPIATAAEPARDKEVIVAQIDQQSDRSQRAAAPVAAARARQPQPAATPAPATPAAPTVVASYAPEATAAAREPVAVTAKAAAPPLAAAPAMPPSLIQRRAAVVPPAAPAPAAKAAPQGETTTVAAADTSAQRVEVEASRTAFSGPGVSDALKKSAPNAAGSLVAASARLLPTPLHAAADRGDVEVLKRLLANPSTPVDAPDSAGRTALLHAVQAQQPAAVRLLLAAGADPARADQAGLTPRAAARTGASAEIAALLAAPR